MKVGLPVILAALMKRGSSAGGLDAIGAALGGLGKNPMDALGTALGGDTAAISSAASSGSDMLGSLLGVGSAGAMASKLAAYAGVDEKAVGPLLGLAGTTALSGLKSTADSQGLDTAGLMKLLGSQKDQISAAIPADVSRLLDGTGLLPQMPRVAAAVPTPPPAAAAAGGGMMKWIIGLAVLAVVLWGLSRFLGGSAPEATPAPEAAAPAATEAPAATADALVVDGVNLGESVTGILTAVTGALAEVKDVASAQSALTKLTGADTSLGDLQGAVAGLSAEGKTALSTLIGAALPTLRTTVDGLLADSGIGPILKPVLDGIMAKLTAYAG
jgi:hypothetical protein